jgi:hypothetical protein
VIKLKKGPVCYVYYAIKNKRQARLKEEKRNFEEKELLSHTDVILSNN